ncbi:alpha-L-fucosidase-domain-containing protein [Mycena rosella]|uniref:alpha-L-fucosidase n=1 Tax=Mycena rosella TaxID=1033263 RepID=A0AAD7D831_MYCRO|nr:alpha-L-fucosidase-domain-containing protein [Mycena rosella]
MVGLENIETMHEPKPIQAAGALCMDRVAVLWSVPTAHRPREVKGPMPSRPGQNQRICRKFLEDLVSRGGPRWINWCSTPALMSTKTFGAVYCPPTRTPNMKIKYPLAILNCLPVISVIAIASKYPLAALPLPALFDTQAASTDGAADFDAHGASLNSQYLPPGSWVHDGITPTPKTGGDGRSLIMESSARTPSLRIAGHASDLSALNSPYSFQANGTQKNWNSSLIYQWSTAIPSEQPLTTITLPPVNTAHRLHLFAVSMSPATPVATPPTAPSLVVRRARFTTRWETVRGVRAQAVEIILVNMLPSFTLSPATSITSAHQIEVVGTGIPTLAAGVVQRLVSGDQARVDVLMTGETAVVQVRDAQGRVVLRSKEWAVAPLVEQWTADADVLVTHETPIWHPFTLGRVQRSRTGTTQDVRGVVRLLHTHAAERHQPDVESLRSACSYHRENLGSSSRRLALSIEFGDLGRLDTAPAEALGAAFTAAKFDAGAWVDLFDRAGAKYFVVVRKHHDGFSLFDTGNTTHRSSVHLGPKRDLVAELLYTAKEKKPNFRRKMAYYSLAEWFA